MNKSKLKYYALIIVFLAVAITFFTNSEISTAEFLIFLFSGILIGINILKIKKFKKD